MPATIPAERPARSTGGAGSGGSARGAPAPAVSLVLPGPCGCAGSSASRMSVSSRCAVTAGLTLPSHDSYLAPVDHQSFAVDERGVVGGEERVRGGAPLGLTGAPGGDEVAGVTCREVLVAADLGGDARVERGEDVAGTERVHPD